MDRTRRLLPLAALGAAATLAPRAAGACDAEAMNAHLTEVCDGALAPARAAIEAALPHATPEERALIGRALAAAGTGCATGDPVAGARLAATLARIAGRIEGRAGLRPADLAPLV